MQNLNYLTDHILYQIFKINLSLSLKNSPPIRIFVTEIENRTMLYNRIETGYYLELLTPETMKLLESTVSKISKDENGENMPQLEIIEAVLVHFITINNDYQQHLRTLHAIVPNKLFGQLLDISPKQSCIFKSL